jgi:release factor glutamine methyltransferase
LAEPPRISQVLQDAQSCGLTRLDAQILLLHSLGRPSDQRAWLIAHGEKTLTEAQQQTLHRLMARRLSGEPVAYLLGRKEFFGMELAVDARVLVPRPDTEILVEWALEVLASKPTARVVDLGTGSGAVALALKQQMRGLEVWGVDSSAGALTVARSNAEQLGLPVRLVQASWLSPWTSDVNRWDVIVSNPPYICDGDPHLEGLVHEPQSALVAGADGLEDIRQIITQAASCLCPGGHLLLEHGYDQAEAVRALLCDSGFEQVVSRRDLQGIERCSGGARPKMK